jgi:hypothetical protein
MRAKNAAKPRRSEVANLGHAAAKSAPTKKFAAASGNGFALELATDEDESDAEFRRAQP